MSSKQNLIIEKLLSIAENRQKSLVVLAQVAQGADPEAIKYLKGAWQTAALNSGVTEASTPEVTFQPGSENDGVQVSETYTCTGPILAQLREQFDRNFKNQIKSQKPELDGKVSTIFNDPTPVKSAGDKMDSKKVIEKLVKIAEKQQKIINKMAQDMGMGGAEQLSGSSSSWADASAEVAPVVQQAAQGAKAKYTVQSAEFGKDSGTLKVKLQYPMAQLGGPEAKAVSDKVKALLAGKTIAGGQVSHVEVIGVAV